MKENTSVGLSVVVCTYNGAERLAKTLGCIANQKDIETLDIELIVVNNASTDNSKLVAQEAWLSYSSPFKLQIIDEKRPGKGYAVEAGYDAANYDYIVTVDDDNWIEENYLRTAFDIIHNNPEIGLLGGQGIAVFEEKQPEWFESFQQSYAVGRPIPHSGFYPKSRTWVWGAGMILKREIWMHLRRSGFSFITSKGKGKAVGEDTELSLLASYMGFQHYFDERLKFYHYMPANRMKWENCISMYDGFARSSAFTNIYKFIEDRIKKNKQPTLFHYLFILGKYSIGCVLYRNKKRVYFFKNRKLEGDKDYINSRELVVLWKTIFNNLNDINKSLKKVHSCYIKLSNYKLPVNY